MKESQLVEDVQRLKAGLADLPDPVVKPFLVMVSGLPGTGKSYFCRRLAEKVSLAILESDDLRKLLFPRPAYTAEESFRLFQACYKVVEDLLKGGITLAFDATNLEEPHRERFYHIADQLGAGLIIVQVDAPPEVVYQRLEGRATGVDLEDKSEADWEVYRRMRSRVQRIHRNHFVVDTSEDITPTLEKVVHRIGR